MRAVRKVSFAIRGEYITLGQLLKVLDIVPTGGQAKMLIKSGQVKVNGDVEVRRGRKLRPGDTVQVDDLLIELVAEGEV